MCKAPRICWLLALGVVAMFRGHASAQCPNPTNGPDVIVGDLMTPSRYGRVGDITAFSIGTTSCNIGNQNLLWISNTNQHPVIAQNMYRLKTVAGSTRFEHIGMSWLKHGFLALTENLCCTCNGQGGAVLGVGCSDPYTASLNGDQSGLGPRSLVNAATGGFPYNSGNSPPFGGSNCAGGDIICKRLQVHDADLSTNGNAGALYFVEGQYITPDDAAAGNKNNNASYRRINVSENTANTFTIAYNGSTQRTRPGIQAWLDNDPTVLLYAVDVPGDGRIWVGSKATDLGNGIWHYEFAVHNLNSDRSAGSFSVPIPAGATVTNIGFHDVDYHSTEPFPTTDWTGSAESSAVTWTTQSFNVNQNANALRWGTLYNFRFDCDAPPIGSSTATIGLFKPPVQSVFAFVRAPAAGDCNTNGIADSIDISSGASFDCQTNMLPDECEIAGNDCNANNIPDSCEGTDCNTNGVRDFCELAGNDCNNNGVLDRCDLAGGAPDCNTNNRPDSCDLTVDCDANGVPDICQPDCDLDGQIDPCEPNAGDCNTNGRPDGCDVTGFPGGPTVWSRLNLNLPIPDSGGGSLVDVRNVPIQGNVLDVDVWVNLTHTYVGDLRIVVTKGAASCTLWNMNCSNADNMNIVFADGAPARNCSNINPPTPVTYRPYFVTGNALTNFNGINAFGDWSITITDLGAQDVGNLLNWELRLNTTPVSANSPDVDGNGTPDECQCPTCPGDMNGDASVDGDDVGPFVNSLLGAYDRCADMNTSGSLTQADINAFLNAAVGGPVPCP